VRAQHMAKVAPDTGPLAGAFLCDLNTSTSSLSLDTGSYSPKPLLRLSWDVTQEGDGVVSVGSDKYKSKTSLYPLCARRVGNNLILIILYMIILQRIHNSAVYRDREDMHIMNRSNLVNIMHAYIAIYMHKFVVFALYALNT
jgi:hypothetical protein